MTDLIERLEAGETGWEINRDIGFALGGWEYLPADHEVCQKWPDVKWIMAGDQIFQEAPGAIQPDAYSESIDAAVALVERVLPDWFWNVSKVFPSGAMRADLQPPALRQGDHWVRGIGPIAYAPIPAAALVAALLKAERGE